MEFGIAYKPKGIKMSIKIISLETTFKNSAC